MKNTNGIKILLGLFTLGISFSGILLGDFTPSCPNVGTQSRSGCSVYSTNSTWYCNNGNGISLYLSGNTNSQGYDSNNQLNLWNLYKDIYNSGKNNNDKISIINLNTTLGIGSLQKLMGSTVDCKLGNNTINTFLTTNVCQKINSNRQSLTGDTCASGYQKTGNYCCEQIQNTGESNLGTPNIDKNTYSGDSEFQVNISYSSNASFSGMNLINVVGAEIKDKTGKNNNIVLTLKPTTGSNQISISIPQGTACMGTQCYSESTFTLNRDGSTSSCPSDTDSLKEQRCIEKGDIWENCKCKCNPNVIGRCCGIQLNTVVPFIGDCIEITNGNDISQGVNQLNAFPYLMQGISKILITVILIFSIIVVIVAGLLMSTSVVSDGNYKKGIGLLKKVIIALILLGCSGLILSLINPTFFGG